MTSTEYSPKARILPAWAQVQQPSDQRQEMTRKTYELVQGGDILLKSLAGDADGDDGDADGGDYESDLNPCHHPGLRPIVIQWVGREVVGMTWRSAPEEVGITAESGLSHHRPHCQKQGTRAQLEHNTLPPLLLLCSLLPLRLETSC